MVGVGGEDRVPVETASEFFFFDFSFRVFSFLFSAVVAVSPYDYSRRFASLGGRVKNETLIKLRHESTAALNFNF